MIYYMPETVLARLELTMPSLPRAELRVARVIRADYPSAGLNTVATLAKSAEVSGPTVLRLIERLGFDGFHGFHEALRGELSMRTKSPLELYSEATHELDTLQRAERRLVSTVQRTFRLLDPAEMSHAIGLISDAKKRITCVGGRFTSAVARSLALHLEVIRADSQYLGPEDLIPKILDFTSKDTAVVFDLRRYQESTGRFAREVRARGSRIILVTDEWVSPISAIADVVLRVGLEAPSPFDSLVGAETLVETLIAGVVDRLGDTPHDRIAAYDALWGDDEIGSALGPDSQAKPRSEDNPKE